MTTLEEFERAFSCEIRDNRIDKAIAACASNIVDSAYCLGPDGRFIRKQAQRIISLLIERSTNSDFGSHVRRLRINAGEVLGDMAKWLGVGTAYLSGAENGRRPVPREWADKIIEHFGLDAEEAAILRREIEDTHLEN